MGRSAESVVNHETLSRISHRLVNAGQRRNRAEGRGEGSSGILAGVGTSVRRMFKASGT